MGNALGLLWKHRTIAVLAVAGLALGWQQHRIAEAREARVNAEIALDSAEAAADSTREVLEGAFDTNLRYYQRRIVQVREMAADSVEEELGTDPRFRGDVTAQVDSLLADVVGERVETESKVRAASFSGYQKPYTFRADVEIPPAGTDAPTMHLEVLLDPIPIRVRVGCEEAQEGRKVRPAQATVRGPEWANLRLDSLQSDASVCNRAVVDPDPGVGLYLSGVAAGATSGVVLAEDPTWQDAAIGAGVGLVTSFAAEQAMSAVGLR